MNLLDNVNARILLAQAGPGQNIKPQAPEGFRNGIEKGLGLAMYIGMGLAIIGVIVAGASMVVSRREGTSEEATSMALRIGFGCLIIGGATSIISFLTT